MFFLFLTKKPIVLVWLAIFYILISLIQAFLVGLVQPLHLLIFRGGFMVCLPFIFFFYRVYRYFCIGYFTVLNPSNLNFRGIPLKIFKKSLMIAIGCYGFLVLLNIALSVHFHFEKFFFIALCLSTLIYERIFLYASKWTIIYELANHGIKLDQKDFQGALNEVRQVFLSSFSNRKVES
jgi:hypothetical protein